MKKIISNLITPFNENEVDFDFLIRLIELNKINRIDYLSLFSLVGEGLNLNEDEKKEIYKIVKMNFLNRVVINVYKNSTEEVFEEIDKYSSEDIIYLHKPYLYEFRKEDIIKFYEIIIKKYQNRMFYLECNNFIISELNRLNKYVNVKGLVVDSYVSFESEKIILENDTLITKCVTKGIEKFITNIGFYYGNLINEIIEDWKINFKNILLYSYLELTSEVFNELPSPYNIKYYLSLKYHDKEVSMRIPQYEFNISNTHFDLLM